MAGIQLAALTIFFYAELNLDEQRWGAIATASVAGTALGFCQWVWLRRRLVKAGWWIGSTLLGWYLAWFLGTMFDLNPNLPNGAGTLRQLIGPLELLSIPLAFGLPQWVFIRRQFRKGAWLWFVIRPIAWLTGFGLFILAAWLNIVRLGFLFERSAVFGKIVPDPVAYGLAVAIFGFGFAAVTGAAFIWIEAGSPQVLET